MRAKTKIFSFLTIMSLLIVCNPAFSDPKITSVFGTALDGSSITLNGSDFGLHVDNSYGEHNYLMNRFDDIESGSINTWWSVGSATISTDNARRNSTYSAKHDGAGSNMLERRYPEGQNKITKMFISMWAYVSMDFYDDNDSQGNQIKLIGPTNSSEFCSGQGSGKTYFSIFRNSSQWSFNTNTEDRQGARGNQPVTNWLPEATWTRLDVWVDIDNNVIQWKVNNRVPNGTTSYLTCGGNNRPPADFGYAAFVNYISGISSSSYILSDDHYIDFTRARVEIGNQPTWNDSDHREIQLPISWSSDSISVEVNKGSFANGETAYLFVVDTDGNASEGHEITIGGSGGGDTIPPGDVTDFIAQAGDGQITLSWINPTDSDFKGTMISYSTGDDPYPVTHNEGTFVCDREAAPGSSDSFTVTGLVNDIKYNFSAFTYDEAGNYSETAHVTATPTEGESGGTPSSPYGLELD